MILVRSVGAVSIEPATTAVIGDDGRPVSLPVSVARPVIQHPTLARLTEGTRLLRRIVADRPGLVCEALLSGATSEQVADAVGLDLVELQTAVSRWAPRLRQNGQLTDRRYTSLMNIVFGPAG